MHQKIGVQISGLNSVFFFFFLILVDWSEIPLTVLKKQMCFFYLGFIIESIYFCTLNKIKNKKNHRKISGKKNVKNKQRPHIKSSKVCDFLKFM